MPGKKTTIVIIEALSLALLTGAANLLVPAEPGFAHLYYIPYTLGALLFAGIYGVGAGMMSLGASIIVVAAIFPFVRTLVFPELTYDGYWRGLVTGAAIPAPVALIIVYAIGMVRSSAFGVERRLKQRIEKLSRENWLLKQKSDSLYEVNQELEERVSKQRDAITSLHTQFRKLEILDLSKALEVLLETVQIFTGATRLSVWKYDERTDSLLLAANRGFDETEEQETSLSLDETIEGWVFRNNNVFSVRMVLQYDNLKKMDRGRNLITFPLLLQRKSWGILNICEMPFEKYNLYTERLLHIIVTLAEHSLDEAVFYESIIRRDEIDEDTGLPLFSQFYRMLEEETRRSGVRKGDFTVVLIEFMNYGEIIRESGTEEGKHLIRAVVDAISELSENRSHMFHYKDESQIAILYPNLDYDGASLFCLETLDRINGGNWQIRDRTIDLEAVIGFSVFSGQSETSDSMLESAENLLEMQKL